MGFRVRLENSGRSFEVEAGETLVEAALRQGIGLPYGCRSGACGACIGTLRSGRVEYPGGLPPALEKRRETDDQAVFCQAVPASDLVIQVREVEQIEDVPVRTLPCRAQRLERLSPDVMRVELKLPASERLRFLAGQYIEFLLKDGRRRAFSIANAPHRDDFIELHIRHVSGGSFTGHVFDDMKARTLLRIEGPLGAFFLREDSDRPILMMGGGTGFAPLKGMLEHAFHIGLQRPIHLFWGARARADLYLHELPLAWAREHPNFTYTPVLSEPAPDDDWQGETGLVTDAVVRHYPDLGDHDIYMSGPPVMIEEATPLFVSHGADMQHMYSDAFEFAQDVLDKIKAKA